MDPLQIGVNLRPTLLAAGVTDRQLTALRRTGQIETLRPGAYVAAMDDARSRHRLAAHAAAAHLDRGAVFSHATAAVLHGLPLWAVGLGRVHATRGRPSGARRSNVVHLHAAVLDPGEVTAIEGLPVTSVARTLVDLGRCLSFEQALVPADGALHLHLVTRAELDAALDHARRRPGNAAARQVLAFARPGATSAGESRSRLAIHRAGLPAPTLQQRIGPHQVDFWWEDMATVGEFDGRVKYGRLLAPGQEPGDVVFAEKLREDALRALGCEVARWTWGELDAFAGPAERLRAAFARHRPH